MEVNMSFDFIHHLVMICERTDLNLHTELNQAVYTCIGYRTSIFIDSENRENNLQRKFFLSY